MSYVCVKKKKSYKYAQIRILENYVIKASRIWFKFIVSKKNRHFLIMILSKV